jgi:hypothetical protein
MKMTELRLSQLVVDTTKQTIEITATAAIVDPKSGVAAWHKCSGNVWGAETQQKLQELFEAMELDIARVVMDGFDNQDGTRSPRTSSAGIGEHVGGGEPSDDPPQM